MADETVYRVADRGMPATMRMIAKDDREWFAGDAITEDDLGAESFAWMLAEGVIEDAAGSSGAPGPADLPDETPAEAPAAAPETTDEAEA